MQNQTPAQATQTIMPAILAEMTQHPAAIAALTIAIDRVTFNIGLAVPAERAGFDDYLCRKAQDAALLDGYTGFVAKLNAAQATAFTAAVLEIAAERGYIAEACALYAR